MISIKNLSFSYTGKSPFTLSEINLDVHKGDYISILGENGSGKSTLLKLILGFLQPTKGTITVSDSSLRYVAQKNEAAMKGFPITVREVLSSYGKLLSLPSSETDRVLDLVGMKEYKSHLIGELSGGQQQRISLARAFMGNPTLILLDEPSTGVDLQNQQIIYSLLKEYNQKKQVTILSVEHNLDAALSNSTLIYHLKEGSGHLCSPSHYAKEFLHLTEKEGALLV